jgi:hypothetical protein
VRWRGDQRRTKHLNIKYHHFREEVRKGTISIYHIRTEDQIADIFTKPLPEVHFVKFREKMMGWQGHHILRTENIIISK